MYTNTEWERICNRINGMVLLLHAWTKEDSLLVDRLEALAQDMVWNGYGMEEVKYHLRGIVEAFYGE